MLSTLQGWKYGFDSPFRSEVYFVSTRQITDLKWGTPNPIMLRDPEFGPIRLRAFGTYALRANDPKALLRELVGTDGVFETGEINELLRSMVATTLADMLGKSEIAALDLAANYTAMSEKLRQAVLEQVDDEYGLDLPQLFIVNISLPEEVEKALDTRTQMGVIGDMQRFQQYQMGQAMTAAAENPSGGGAAEGMGLGMGFAMANQMMGGMPMGAGAPQQPSAPPPPAAGRLVRGLRGPEPRSFRHEPDGGRDRLGRGDVEHPGVDPGHAGLGGRGTGPAAGITLRVAAPATPARYGVLGACAVEIHRGVKYVTGHEYLISPVPS